MANTTTLVFRGKASYAKILGDPVPNFNKDGMEWKMDLELLDKGSVDKMNELGVGDRVKNKEGYLDGAPHLSFKQAELTKQGKPNKKVAVVDAAGNPWPEDRLIGNGSIVEVRFVVMDFGPNKYKGVYMRSVRVLDLVPYVDGGFEPLAEDDEFYDKAKEAEEQQKLLAMQPKETEDESPPFKADDDLDDEMPV